VRELQNALRNRMLGLDPGLAPEPTHIPPEPPESLPRPLRDGVAPLSDAVSWYAAHVVARSDDNLSRAARTLGIDRATLRRHLAGRTRA
jgi:DNA-binding NtrC family response regulator